MRTVIYARYSDELQNFRSVDDQISICRERADREGWPIVGVYSDAAISGAAGVSATQRPQFAAMLERIKAGGVDQVLVEAQARTFRDEGDFYETRRWLEFLGVRLFTLQAGVVDRLSGSFRAIVDAQQRRDTGEYVKRGQRGTVSDGRLPAGLAYGYSLANQIDERGGVRRGLRSINEEQADIVRRIFREFVSGVSARKIAEGLNRDEIPSPAGLAWTSSTILGDRKRGNGLLKNELYVGKIVHFRTRKVTHPETRRDLIRPTVEQDRVVGDAPHLRIIDDELWERAQSEIAIRSAGPREYQRRPKRLLSELMKCGICGSTITIKNNDYWGCGGYQSGKICTNNRRILNRVAEERVLAGLQASLLDPELVDRYVAKYVEQRAARAREIERERARVAEAHRNAVLRVERLIEAIANGADEFEEVRDMMRRARTERDDLAGQMAALERFAPIALHPSIARDYRKQIDALAVALADPHARIEAVPQVRALIGTIIATPAVPGRGLTLAVTGRLDAILRMAAGEPLPHAGMAENPALIGHRA